MDNLTILKQQVDTALPLTGASERVKVAQHNPLEKSMIDTLGRYVGFPFIGKNTNLENTYGNPGFLYWEGNPMNSEEMFIMNVSKLTQDGNDIGRILEILIKGSIIKIKDYKGRSTTLKYDSYVSNEDVNGNTYYSISVTGFPENTNYSYQANDAEPCFFEALNVGGSAEGDLFSGVSLKIFTNKYSSVPGYEDSIIQAQETAIIEDADTGDEMDTYLKMLVHLLGVHVEGYDIISSMNPKLIIERHNFRNRAGNAANQFQTPTSFKKHKVETVRFKTINGQDGDVQRPNEIPLTAEKAYYDIKAENYFRNGYWGAYYQKMARQYQAMGNIGKKNKRKRDGFSIEIRSTDTEKMGVHKYDKCYVYLRLRLQVEVEGIKIISAPMVTFRLCKFFDLATFTSFNYNQYGIIRIAPQQR